MGEGDLVGLGRECFSDLLVYVLRDVEGFVTAGRGMERGILWEIFQSSTWFLKGCQQRKTIRFWKGGEGFGREGEKQRPIRPFLRDRVCQLSWCVVLETKPAYE